MRLVGEILLFILLAAGLGLGSAYIGLNNSRHLGLYEVGAWKAWPAESGPSADPYARASLARSGALLLGPAEGIAFEATTDRDGTPLDGACQYRIRGEHLPARLWTLTLTDSKGQVIQNPSNRYSFDSRSVMWQSEKFFDIVTSPFSSGGNWLQSPQNGAFRLILRLYESPVTSGGLHSDISLPDIEWIGCQ